MKIKYIILSFVLVLYGGSAYCGAEALVYGCLYLDTDPSGELKVHMKVGTNNHCMISQRGDKDFTINKSGVTCVKIGQIKEKASSSKGDSCATDASHWHLSYTADGTSWSGAADVQLSHPFLKSNHAKFNSSSPGTQMCNSAAKCGAIGQQWNSGTVGDLYLIFDPSASSSQ